MNTATELIEVPATFLHKADSELNFFCDFIGLVNNNFDAIDESTRNDMLILAVERVNGIRLQIKDVLQQKAEY